MTEIIKTEELTKCFGDIRAVDNLSLNIEEGENFGLLGPNGAGKTTLIRLINGLLRPTSGKVWVLGKPMPSRKVASNIGYMTQLEALYLELTVRENISFFASIYGLDDKAEREQRIDELVELIDLKERENSLVEFLSGGMRQRVSLACALVHRPKLLLLDEPTIGIDPELRILFWDYFKELNEQGATLIITSHDMSEAERCHKLGFMRGGKIIAQGSPNELKKEVKKPGATLEDAFLHFTEKKNVT